MQQLHFWEVPLEHSEALLAPSHRCPDSAPGTDAPPAAPTDLRPPAPLAPTAETAQPRLASVEFVRHPRARRYLIRVRLDGSVRVTIPNRGSKREATAFYEQQRDWVAAQLAQAHRLPAVQKAIMPPPAGTAKNWAAYRERFVEPRRVQAGLDFWRAHEAELQRAEATYGVPAAIVVANRLLFRLALIASP